ncbi:MAG: PIG-L family deacetylase [Firmicutes bacterium]|nr:PIG-L family deacetylase [Bacillota bacterium]
MEIYLPNCQDEEQALSSVTHLAIAAHQDDIEIMAYDGILKCFGQKNKNFAGVTVTNGRGSPRSGIYASYTDEQMQEVRKREQKKAAFIGEYSAQIFLDHLSSNVKNPDDENVVADFKTIIQKTKPDYIYTHNLADKHDTHVGVALKVIKALRELSYIPKAVFGCEVWRNLDWMQDDDKVKFDASGHGNLEAALLGVFDSQIAGGKRYDLATSGRRIANATFSESHSVDISTSLSYAMDLTPLAADKTLEVGRFVLQYINNFSKDVLNKLEALQ